MPEITSSDNQEPFYVTQAEAAKLICKRPRWLERARYAGGGPPFRYVGRTPVYEKSKLLDWMQELPPTKNTSGYGYENKSVH